jgi:hypothetical protein
MFNYNEFLFGDLVNENKNNLPDDFIQYDSIADINDCLNCNKPECTNCLKLKNGV